MDEYGPDPVVHFKQACKERTAAREAEAQVQAVAIEIHPQQRIDKRTVARKSIGSAVLLAVYNALGVETVIRNATRGSGADYDANAVMRLLAVERILDLEGNWWRFDHRTDASDDLCRMAGVDLTRQNMQLKDIKAVLSQAKLQIPIPNRKM